MSRKKKRKEEERKKIKEEWGRTDKRKNKGT